MPHTSTPTQTILPGNWESTAITVQGSLKHGRTLTVMSAQAFSSLLDHKFNLFKSLNRHRYTRQTCKALPSANVFQTLQFVYYPQDILPPHLPLPPTPFTLHTHTQISDSIANPQKSTSHHPIQLFWITWSIPRNTTLPKSPFKYSQFYSQSPQRVFVPSYSFPESPTLSSLP